VAQLVVVEGTAVGEVFDLSTGATLGSAADNSITLADRRVAAHQARFEVIGDAVHITSLDPARAVVVNNAAIQRQALAHGDIIAIGDTLMLFNAEEPAKSTSAAAPSPNSSLANEPPGSDTIRIRRPLIDSDSAIEERRDLARTKAARQLSALYHLSSAVHELHDEESLLAKILELTFQVVPAERGVILIDDTTGALRPRAHLNILSRRGEVPRPSRTILAEVLATREGVLTTDAPDSARLLSGISIVEQNIRSVMCVPLVYRDKLFGVIHLDTSSLRKTFDAGDLKLLTGIAHLAAGAIENVRLFVRRRQHSQDLIVLSRMTQELSRHLDKAKIHTEAVEIARELVGASRVSLLTVEPPRRALGTRLKIVHASGMGDIEWRKMSTPIEADQPSAQAVREGTSILVGSPDPAVNQPMRYEPNPERYDTKSFIVVPIRSNKQDVFEIETKAIGCLCATDKTGHAPFDQRDLQLLEILASQVGIALTNAELYERATVDALTRVFVRRYFVQRIEEFVPLAHERNHPLSLLMIDIDHFKNVNDTHGHQTGDVILRELGRLLRHKVRPRDIPARYGGEEFAVLLYDAPLDVAEKIAGKIHRSIAKHVFDAKRKKLSVTTSIGVAQLAPGETETQLIKKADQALYRAKHEGRNRVVVA